MALLVRGSALGRPQLRLPMVAPADNRSYVCVVASVRNVGLLGETGLGSSGLKQMSFSSTASKGSHLVFILTPIAMRACIFRLVGICWCFGCQHEYRLIGLAPIGFPC